MKKVRIYHIYIYIHTDSRSFQSVRVWVTKIRSLQKTSGKPCFWGCYFQLCTSPVMGRAYRCTQSRRRSKAKITQGWWCIYQSLGTSTLTSSKSGFRCFLGEAGAGVQNGHVKMVGDTVDGRNPAPVGMYKTLVNITISTGAGFLPSTAESALLFTVTRYYRRCFQY